MKVSRDAGMWGGGETYGTEATSLSPATLRRLSCL